MARNMENRFYGFRFVIRLIIAKIHVAVTSVCALAIISEAIAISAIIPIALRPPSTLFRMRQANTPYPRQ